MKTQGSSTLPQQIVHNLIPNEIHSVNNLNPMVHLDITQPGPIIYNTYKIKNKKNIANLKQFILYLLYLSL